VFDFGEKVAIIGGGFLGSELAYSLAHRGKDRNVGVWQIFPEEGNMALVFPKYLSTWTTHKLRQGKK
jgi:apoptosis-inducing factor 1